MDTGPSQSASPLSPKRSPLHTSKGPHIHANFYNSKGLTVIVSGVVFVVALVKAKPEDIPKIVQMIVDSHSVGVLGWFLAFGVLLMAVVAVKLMKSIYDKEIERLTMERNQLQQMLLNREGGTR